MWSRLSRLGLLLASVFFVVMLPGNLEANPCPDCECYPTREPGCPLLKYCCGYWEKGCECKLKQSNNKMLDGICVWFWHGLFSSIENPVNPWELVSREEVVEGLDLYFVAFDEVIQRRGGRPEEEVWNQAITFPLPDPWPSGLQRLMFAVLDLLFGWNFRPEILACPLCPEELRPFLGGVMDWEKARELLSLVREGMIVAILENNPTAVRPFLREFWSRRENRRFRPGHTGRCYPHGHEEVRRIRDTFQCQANGIEAILSSFFQGTPPE
ncbi:MAG: hypothetical protein KatS3mg131_0901 [Candidatus Tectimicrobiota bacterium]|nr:MAG: hypothetical protein KatS3mg131_0901 [Candidatus Tectomicrobia bacterium]